MASKEDRSRVKAIQIAVESNIDATDPYLQEELEKIGSRLQELMSELDNGHGSGDA